MKPLISICIPVYNAGPYLEACLDSVLSQDLSDYEIIAVDDGSTDESLQVLGKYAARCPALKVHINASNRGLVGNWNRCLELAEGVWIKFVFQDDLLLPGCLKKMMEFSSLGSPLVVCKRKFLLEENASDSLKQYFGQTVLSLDKIYGNAVPPFINAALVSDLAVRHPALNIIGEPSTILFRKSVLDETGVFDPAMSQICDLEFCLRIASRKGLAYVSEPLVLFRVHAASATSSNTTRKRFSSLFSDPAILSYKLLNDPVFDELRSSLSFKARLKLRLYHAMKLYEAHLFLRTNKDEAVQKQAEALKKYPGFEVGAHPGLLTRLAYLLARFRRRQHKEI